MPRNPFSVDDVPNPLAPDVEDFAKSLRIPSDPGSDENALAWVTVATEHEGLEGAWTSRYRTTHSDWKQGVVTLRIDGDKVFLIYRDSATYLIEAQRRDNKLVGRYVNVEKPEDTSPWLGIIVDNYRIDGFFGNGRWDMRRCSPSERPEPIVAALVTEARKLGANEIRELLGFARYLRWKAEGEK